MRPGIRISAAGDITATSLLSSAALDRRTAITGILTNADVAIGCFEVPLTHGGVPVEKRVLYRADPAIAADYRALGFGVLSLANNHIMNYGSTGVEDTCSACDAVDLRYLGAGSDLASAAQPLRLDLPGGRLGLLAVSCLLPTGTAAAEDRAGVNPLRIHTAYEVDANFLMEEPGLPPAIHTWPDDADLERVLGAIAELRPTVDAIVLAIHWGLGRATGLVSYQQPLAHRLIDAGVDVLLGSHPRVLHGIERHGDGVIIYSQGSFAAQTSGATKPSADTRPLPGDGMLAEIVLVPGARAKLVAHPTVVGEEGVAVLATDRDRDRIAERIMASSAEFGTTVELSGEGLRLA